MVRSIIKFPKPSLRAKCIEVSFPLHPALSDHIRDLKDTLAATPHGVALASNQTLAEGLRVFVVRPGSCDLPEVVINPRWTPVDWSAVPIHEGCLSVPEHSAFVSRHDRVTLVGRTEGGEYIEQVVRGLAAQIVQHECDHLDGKLILDYADAKTQVRVRAEAIRNRKRGL